MTDPEQPVYSKHRPSYFTPKIKFTKREDQILLEVVTKIGTGDWHAVAEHLPSRNPRQCRERWNNYVNPQISQAGAWTEEEDRLLESKYEEIGARWRTLASFFPTRSTNNVKNRFVVLQRRKKRKSGRRNAKRTEESSDSSTPTSSPSEEPEKPQEIEKRTPVKENDPLAFMDEVGGQFDEMWITTQEPSMWNWFN